MMKAIERIATSLGLRGDKANQDLADEIIRTTNKDWIEELVNNLHHKDKEIQSDCIKVLYEVGERGAPELIAPFIKEFADLLHSKNNRLVWGGMIALDMITPVPPGGVSDHLPVIMQAIDHGSVITIDHGVGILAGLSAVPGFADIAFPLLLEQLRKCPPKQLPMYAEKSLSAINLSNQKEFIELLESRYGEMGSDSQKKRIEKVLRQVKKSKDH